MSKKIILDALTSTIGCYIKNLDVSNMHVSIFSGKLQLTDVEVDAEHINKVLSGMGEPSSFFQVLDGTVNSVEVHVPWVNMYSKSVTVKVKGVRVRARKRNANPSGEEHAQRGGKGRQANLERMEGERLKYNLIAFNPLTASESEEEMDEGFGARLIRRIVENVYVELSDVRVDVKCDVKCGNSDNNDNNDNSNDQGLTLKLDSAGLYTTDEMYVARYVTRDDDGGKGAGGEQGEFFKVFKVDGFAVDVDAAPSSSSSSSSPSQSLPSSSVLSPINFSTKLRYVPASLAASKSSDTPSYTLCSNLDSVDLALSEEQLSVLKALSSASPETGTDAASSSSRMTPLYPEHRPVERPADAPAKWWKYALRSVGRLTRRRSWAEYALAVRRRREYMQAWKCCRYSKRGEEGEGSAACKKGDYDYPKLILPSPFLPVLSSSRILTLSEVHADPCIPPRTVMSWRTLAEEEYALENEEYVKKFGKGGGNKAGGDEVGGLMDWFFGERNPESDVKSAASLEEEDMSQFQNSLKSLRSSLMSTSSYAASAPEVATASTGLLSRAKFTLTSMSVNLVNVAKLDVTSVSLAHESTVEGGHDVACEIRRVALQDGSGVGGDEDAFNRIVSVDLSSETDKSFSLRLSKSEAGDFTVSGTLMQFAIVPKVEFVQSLLSYLNGKNTSVIGNAVESDNVYDSFYDANDGRNISASMYCPKESLRLLPEKKPTTEAIMDYASDFVSTTSSAVSSALSDAWVSKVKTNTKWRVDLDIRAPTFIMPETPSDPETTVLIVDFGHLRVRTTDAQKSNVISGWFRQYNVSPDSLDNWEADLTKLRVLTTSASSYRSSTSISQASTIVPPISFSLIAGVEKAVGSASLTCVCGTLPCFSLTASPKSIKAIMSLAEKWSDTFNGNDDQVANDTAVDTNAPRAGLRIESRRIRKSGAKEGESFHEQ